MLTKLRQLIHSVRQPSKSTVPKVLLIIGMFIAICMILVALIYIRGNIFDGVRTYVRGEGLWAKAQKDATFYLIHYSYNKNEVEYQRYLEATSVMLGDHRAREALLAHPVDVIMAKEGFIQGLNDERDTDSLIWFFLNFQSTYYMLHWMYRGFMKYRN